MSDSAQNWNQFLLPNADTPLRLTDDSFAGQTVCVTGAGGFLGSALAKALSSGKLQALILLECSEQRLFELQRSLKEAAPPVPCHYVLGSVRDRRLLADTFGAFRPQTVLHAAAFKHVELLEHHPFAAVENNVSGSYNLAQSAAEQGVSTFLLLSTDKAVNPHSIMGVSKRIAELAVLSLSSQRFQASAIRLVNVIGSSGSVVPIFLDQIAQGRAVSVTDPQASRYFLTEEQAVRATLAAGTARCDGSILLPEVSDPVSIAGLAEFLIRTKSRGRDVPIVFSGLRPGEKMREELIGAGEERVGTVGNTLSVVRSRRLSQQKTEEVMARLADDIARRDRTRLLRSLCQIVPEYAPSEVVREGARELSYSA